MNAKTEFSGVHAKDVSDDEENPQISQITQKNLRESALSADGSTTFACTHSQYGEKPSRRLFRAIVWAKSSLRDGSKAYPGSGYVELLMQKLVCTRKDYADCPISSFRLQPFSWCVEALGS